MTSVKVIATIGPACASSEAINLMVKEGVDGFRINFSHGFEKEWAEYVKLVREAEASSNRFLSVIGDLQGPSIRLGRVEEPFTISRGDTITATLADEVKSGDKALPLPNRKVFEELKEGDALAMDDGALRLSVLDVSRDRIILKALTDGAVSSNKAVVILGREIDLPAISEADVKRLKFALSNGFCYIGLSYARSARDIKTLRSLISDLGGDARIITKIETRAAISNLREIVENSDAVLVARGDLGVHFPLEEVPMLQERIVSMCIKEGKPVVLATQLLGSMVNSSIPTRSETVDVVEAVKEGVDALMLTGETAVGKFPVEAVRWLRRIIRSYEGSVLPPREPPPRGEERDRFAYGVVMLAENLNSKIIVFTKSGKTAARIARFRPRVSLYAASSCEDVLRRISILRGVRPLLINAADYASGLEQTLRELIKIGELSYGDVALLTYGLQDEPAHIVKIVHITPA